MNSVVQANCWLVLRRVHAEMDIDLPRRGIMPESEMSIIPMDGFLVVHVIAVCAQQSA